MSLAPGGLVVPGLRFYVCPQCDTVHAEPMPPTVCPTCRTGEPREITDRLQTDRYFFARHE
jgi:rubrerythrin